MAKRETNVRKLTKTGRGSLYVILPKEHVRSLGWRERQRLVIQRVKRGLLIKDARSKK